MIKMLKKVKYVLIFIPLIIFMIYPYVLLAIRQDDQFEPNNSFNTAVPISEGEYHDLTLADDEWYRFQLNRSAGIRISIKFVGEVVLRVNLYTENSGHLVFSSDNFDNGHNYERYNLSPNEWYYIHITMETSMLATLEYNLKLQILDGGPADSSNWVDNSDPIDSNITYFYQNWIFPIVLSLTSVVILLLLIRDFIQKKAKSIEKPTRKIITSSQEITAEIEKDILEKFQNMLKISQRVPLSSVADTLDLSEKVLFNQLIKWNQKIPFKIDDKMIIVEDLNNFLDALDCQFNEWQDRDISKDGKIE
jgi:hypothetical protein